MNDAGIMIEKCWIENYQYFANIKLHEYVIIPNHFHAIFEIVAVGADSISSRNCPKRADMESAPTITVDKIGGYGRNNSII